MPQGSSTWGATSGRPITHFPLGPGNFVAPTLPGSAPSVLAAPTGPATLTIGGTKVTVNLQQDDANIVLAKFRAAGIPAHLDSHGRLVLDVPTGTQILGDVATLQALGLT